jgi:hypothetical protein
MKDKADIYSTINKMVFDVISTSINATADTKNSFIDIEKNIVSVFMQAAAETIGHCLSAYDMDCPSIEYQGRQYDINSKNELEYFTAAGKVKVSRSLYRNRFLKNSICPLNLNAGIIENNWTAQAAKIATFGTAEMSPYTAERLFKEMGGMCPSKSSLDRLPKKLHNTLEYNREHICSEMREQTSIPGEAVKIGLSLDGVHVPIQKLKGKSRYRRSSGFTETRGCYFLIDDDYSTYKEASCGTVSYFDEEGRLLRTQYYGRMPEERKVKLKNLLEKHVKEDLKLRPDLELVAIADGAKDNWTYIDTTFPDAVKVLNFYHAAEHLKKAIDILFTDGKQALDLFEKYRSILRHSKKGINIVIDFLESQYDSNLNHEILLREINYFKSNALRCNYAEHADNNRPIGSGIVESACKTLVTKRLKCSGMAWRWKGGQAILNFRSHLKSNLFDQLWNVIYGMYRRPVYPYA